MKKKKNRRYEVSMPVAYYEVFFVEASSRAEAIQRVKTGHGSCDQNCTDANKKWSRRILVRERLCDHSRLSDISVTKVWTCPTCEHSLRGKNSFK